jgi:hypothetical protein
MGDEWKGGIGCFTLYPSTVGRRISYSLFEANL